MRVSVPENTLLPPLLPSAMVPFSVVIPLKVTVPVLLLVRVKDAFTVMPASEMAELPVSDWLLVEKVLAPVPVRLHVPALNIPPRKS